MMILKGCKITMNRLTESNPSWIDDELWESACEPDCEEIDAVYRKLKEYEDLEESGNLLRLPCKVGDTVYCIENKEIYTCIVGKISISKNNGVWVEINFPKEMPDIVAIEYNLDDIGKTVFLAKSEAEAAMNKLKGIDNKNIERAYYIKNTSDFTTVVEYLNLCHKFTEKDFCGADWYFFYEDDNDYEDKYWIETLTEKKQKWEEYCKQFEE